MFIRLKHEVNWNASQEHFSLLLLTLIALVFDTRIANACSCGALPTVLEAYENSEAVFIVKVISIQKAEEEDKENYGAGGIKSASLVVQKVFKGDLKAGSEITFGQGGGADCIWTFDEESIGNEFLFYPQSPKNDPRIWFVSTCGRSRSMKFAGDDLLYLNNLKKVQGKTRISGTVGFGYGEETGLSVDNRVVRIIGKNKTYEVKTDEKGVYEIYDLPAGNYLIEPATPKGWKVNGYSLSRSRSFAGGENSQISNKIPIVLEAKKHAALDIDFEIDNAIRGKVFDTNGKVMKGVCIKAVLPDKERDSGYHADCTEADGSFAITEIPRGSYILVINEEGKISSDEPFKTFYYPNVSEREKAAAIVIGEGDMIENINIYIPKMEETITVEGVLLYSDGKPVVDEMVQFEPEKTEQNIDGEAQAKTDSNGRFTIKILKGLKGDLFGEMYTYTGQFEKCPKLESIIKKAARDEEGSIASVIEIKTPALALQADNNFYDVELKYPFPSCKRAK